MRTSIANSHGMFFFASKSNRIYNREIFNHFLSKIGGLYKEYHTNDQLNHPVAINGVSKVMWSETVSVVAGRGCISKSEPKLIEKAPYVH
jgi:hypothetical protein